MKRNILAVFILLYFVQYSNAQMNEYFNDIKATFKLEKQKTLISIAENIKNEESKDADAQQTFSSGAELKGLSESKKIARVYSKNYRNLFFLYENKLKTISKDLEGDKKEYVSYLINDAKNSFRISISERLKALDEGKEKEAFELLKSAHKKEVEAINSLSRAFGVTNGWINEDFKIEKVSYISDDIFDNTKTDNFKVKDFTEDEMTLPNNYSFNKTITNKGGNNKINTNDENNSEVIGNYSTNTNNENNYYDNNNYKTSSPSGTEYRIQIGVSILPASKSQIERLNPTDLNVKTYKSKVYYKYTIGNFSSYQDAKAYKNTYNLAKTYITEYKNGKEIKFYFKDI